MSKPSAARVLALLALAALALPALAPAPALASSHNEAPFTSKHPSLDNTDLYFFRDPNEPDARSSSSPTTTASSSRRAGRTSPPSRTAPGTT